MCFAQSGCRHYWQQFFRHRRSQWCRYPPCCSRKAARQRKGRRIQYIPAAYGNRLQQYPLHPCKRSLPGQFRFCPCNGIGRHTAFPGSLRYPAAPQISAPLKPAPASAHARGTGKGWFRPHPAEQLRKHNWFLRSPPMPPDRCSRLSPQSGGQSACCFPRCASGFWFLRQAQCGHSGYTAP